MCVCSMLYLCPKTWYHGMISTESEHKLPVKLAALQLLMCMHTVSVSIAQEDTEGQVLVVYHRFSVKQYMYVFH